jgi:hypothetical protein
MYILSLIWDTKDILTIHTDPQNPYQPNSSIPLARSWRWKYTASVAWLVCFGIAVMPYGARGRRRIIVYSSKMNTHLARLSVLVWFDLWRRNNNIILSRIEHMHMGTKLHGSREDIAIARIIVARRGRESQWILLNDDDGMQFNNLQ